MKNHSKFIVIIIIYLAILWFSISVGSVFIPFGEIIQVIRHKVLATSFPSDISANFISILWDIRIPRAFCAYFVGAALSVSGCSMQSILQNPLASSYTLGVSSGASLGAAFVITGVITIPVSTFITLPILGFVFGLGTVVLVVIFTKKLDHALNNHAIILVGMVLSLFINAILTLISALSKESIKQLILWQMGSFASRGWIHVSILCPVTVLITYSLTRYSQEMDLITFGDDASYSMGVNTRKVKLHIMVLSAILTGTAVCFTGIIGFVDLIVPHIVRKIFGPSHRILIPVSALLGGTFMMFADTIARTILVPIELPVGAITAIIGAPFFMWIYMGKRGV